ncbi:MAG TPA: hypothetical protein VI231_07675, partial [Candidatus Binatia bacterium]
MKGIAQRPKYLLPLALAAAPLLMGAASEENAGVLLALAVLLPAAKLAGWLAERVRQPAVLGELLAGIVIGNLTLFG